MTQYIRGRWLISRAVMGLVACALVPGSAAAWASSALPPSCTGTSFTWTGHGDGAHWDDAMNWSPSAVPGGCSADNVTIPIEANISGVPAVHLADLAVTAGAGSDGTLLGGPITVSHHFQFDGSTFDATINLPAGSTGDVGGAANFKGLGGGGLGMPGRLNVAGTLTLSDVSGTPTGAVGLGAGIARGVIDVQRTGVLIAKGHNIIGGTSCCGGPDNPTLINDGLIRVISGRLRTDAVVTSDRGHLSVAAGSLFDVNAPIGLGNQSSYAGRGRMLLDLNSRPDSVQGTITLARNFHLELGAQACLAGNATIRGSGTFDFTGGNLPARITIARGTFMHVTGPAGKDLSTFACGISAGELIIAGRMLVDDGTLGLGSRGSLSTAPGGALMIGRGATISQGQLLHNAGSLQLRGLVNNIVSYRQDRTGKLEIIIAGRKAGTGFGQLSVTGKATLAGELRVTTRGFTPRRGATFLALVYHNRAGKFATLSGLPRYRVSYRASGADIIFR